MNHIFFKHLATQGAVGYGQAPGTVATLMMIPFVWYIASLQLHFAVYLVIVGILFSLAWYAVQQALIYFDESDPAAIVLDEMVSFLLVFIAVPVTLKTVFIGFVCFRLLDIYKPLGIGMLDRLHGVTGVMLDDVAAALLSNLMLQALLFFGLLS